MKSNAEYRTQVRSSPGVSCSLAFRRMGFQHQERTTQQGAQTRTGPRGRPQAAQPANPSRLGPVPATRRAREQVARCQQVCQRSGRGAGLRLAWSQNVQYCNFCLKYSGEMNPARRRRARVSSPTVGETNA